MILIVVEYHGNRYFDASTPEKVHKACLKILKERMEQGYYDFGEEPPIAPIDLANVPEFLLEEAKKKDIQQRQSIKCYLDDKAHFQEVKNCIENPEELQLFRGKPRSFYLLERDHYLVVLDHLGEVE